MKGRKGNNEGTITKRADGRWEARATLPDGKRKCYYGKTRQEVARKLITAQRDLAQGLPIVDDRQSIEQYLTEWLETVKHRLKPATHRRYTEQARHITSIIGKVSLSKLTAQQVQSMYSALLKRELSPTTVQHIHVVLHQALKDAMRLGLVQRNVTEMAHAPREEHHEIVTLSEEQARTFLATARGNRFEALYVLALLTGMRLGELLALRWQDVHLKQGYLVVRASVQRDGSKFNLTTPKTEHSRRRIALPNVAQQALDRHRILQEEEKAAAIGGWDETHDLVFPNEVGKIMKPSNLSQGNFQRMLRRAGLQHIRFHDLRHTAATLMLGRGVHVKVVSEMLGHSDISITLGIYAHVLPHMQEAAADTMDTVFDDI